MTQTSSELRHFLDLANASYSSSGTDAARTVAECVLETVPSLDQKALRGLAEFIGRAKHSPETASAMINHHGYDEGLTC